jgi:alpha-L-fucosidase
MDIMDFANDDNFKTSWVSNKTIRQPWIEFDLGKEQTFNTLVLAERSANITSYKIECFSNGKWQPLLIGENKKQFKFHRFNSIAANKIKLTITTFTEPPAITEFGVYLEKR